MERRFKTSAGGTFYSEFVVQTVMWLIVLALPFANELLRVPSEQEFSWVNILRWLIGVITYIPLFLLHNYILIPRYLMTGKVNKYILSILVTMVLFVTFQSRTYEKRSNLFISKVEMQQEETVSFPVQSADEPQIAHSQNASKHKVRFFGIKMPIVLNATLLLLMLGANLAIFFVFRYMNEREKRKALENSRLQDEIRFLKAQINPHFVMNVMNNIHSMIELDPEKAQDMTLELSDLMRYMLYEGDSNAVSLAKEISFISNYVTMGKRRFPADKVQVNFDVPDTFRRDVTVPPLLFIAFVENAFKHGVSYNVQSIINIRLEEKDGKVYFTCVNSIPKTMQVQAAPGGIGLENVKRRLELIYGSGYDLDINTDNGFYNVNLIIPGL